VAFLLLERLYVNVVFVFTKEGIVSGTGVVISIDGVVDDNEFIFIVFNETLKVVSGESDNAIVLGVPVDIVSLFIVILRDKIL
jgi:hypothetical protein